MKIACTQENLKRGLNIVSRVVSRNATLPVLGNVLLKTETSGLRLVATDLELGVSCVVGGKIEETGEITIPAKLLSEYVSQLPRNHVALNLEGKELHLNCDETKAQIKGIAADEFPLLPKFEASFEIQVSAEALQIAIQQVVPAAATDESRPELNGIYVQFEGNNCTLAATDSFRLAEKIISLTQPIKEAKNIIVPIKTLSEVARIIEPEGDIKIQISQNQVNFIYQDIELISRLIEGQYPPYKDILPQDLPTKSQINREEFINAVRAGGLFSKTGAQDVNLTLDASKNKIIIEAKASQVGGHNQEIDAKIDGPADKVIFNYRYLIEGLNILSDELIVLETGGNSSPGKLTSQKDKNFIYIVMPIKL